MFRYSYQLPQSDAVCTPRDSVETRTLARWDSAPVRDRLEPSLT